MLSLLTQAPPEHLRELNSTKSNQQHKETTLIAQMYQRRNTVPHLKKDK